MPATAFIRISKAAPRIGPSRSEQADAPRHQYGEKDIETKYIAVVAAVIGVGGVLIGVVITNHLSASRERRARLAAAAVAFRAAVLGELEGLYPIPVAWPSDIDGRLRAAFPKLQSAVSEFERFLPWYRHRGFNKAWFVYRVGKGGREIDKQCYHQYMAFASNPDPQGTFRHNVDRLLSYAKHT